MQSIFHEITNLSDCLIKVEESASVGYSLENVAAFSFNILSSFLSLSIVSLTMLFSLSYLLFRFVNATSAVFLFDLSTVRNVAICSRFADSKAFNFKTCSCRSVTSALFSLTEAEEETIKIKINCTPLNKRHGEDAEILYTHSHKRCRRSTASL